MMTNCTNKGCFQLQAPVLDITDNKVYCSVCDKELTNVTQFLKTQLKSLKQIRVAGSTSKAYSLACSHCKKENRPFIKDDKIYCSLCNKELNLSKQFKYMLMNELNKSSEI